MYAGVDEAGRGPVLGPLVVAGVLGAPDALPEGIADSKTLTPSRRARLAASIERAPELTVTRSVVSASEINRRMADGQTLDTIETHAFAEVLSVLGADAAVVDTVGADADTFGARLSERLEGACEVTARPRADETDALVGAASILAKVERDDRIRAIADEIGQDIGSGYPSDPTTRAFLTTWRKEHNQPPPFARDAWSTLEKLGFGSRTLTDFTTGGST